MGSEQNDGNGIQIAIRFNGGKRVTRTFSKNSFFQVSIKYYMLQVHNYDDGVHNDGDDDDDDSNRGRGTGGGDTIDHITQMLLQIILYGNHKTNTDIRVLYLLKQQEVYDWVGSLEQVPLHFTLQRGKEVVRHSDPLEQDELLDLAERVSGNDRVSIKQSLNNDLL